MEISKERRANAAFTVGKIMGVGLGMDVAALKDLIENPDSDFRYGKECKAVLRMLEESE